MKLLVIDGNSILNRSFYGVRILTTRDGTSTNALVGFLNVLQKMLGEIKPDTVVVAFDVHAPTFRHERYADYKGTRKGMPDELREQMPLAKEIIQLLGYAILEKEGYEADDIVGTLANACCQDGHECVIATGDRDCLQLITDCVSVRLATTKEAILYTPERYEEQYGIKPQQLVDVKALMGDSSDNIPGVKGIGEKSAFSLIAKYGSLDNIYANIEALEVTPRVKNLLTEGKESAYLSQELATICVDAPIDTDLSHYAKTPRQDTALTALLNKLEMYSFIQKLGLDDSGSTQEATQVTSAPKIPCIANPDLEEMKAKLATWDTVDFLVEWDNNAPSRLLLCGDSNIFAFEHAAEAIKFLLLSNDRPKRTDDCKTLHRWLFQQKLPSLDTIIFDVSLAAYLLDAGGRSYDISLLAKKYQLDAVSVEESYENIAYLPALCSTLEQELKLTKMDSLLHEIELPLSRVLADMEAEGFAVDTDGIKTFGETLYTQIETLREQMLKLVGHEFNPNSTNDLGEILFQQFGLTPKKKTKRGFSTDAETLESLRQEHEFVPLLLEYRKLSKLHSTYVTGLLKVVDDTGRVHSTFKQTETRTGRISSMEPNMQNIPTRTELGREMRKFFVAKPGYVLVDADYSQIELRILAHISNDKRMIDGFNHGADIHRSTSAEVFGVPFDEVTPDLRSRAKAINFGIVYGISAFSLSQDIGVSVQQASQYIKDYLTTYSGVDRYLKDIVATAKEQGYVTTMFGRRRNIDELKSKNFNLRNFGERVAMNAPIQGSAADIIKLAMIHVYQRMKEEEINGKLILQVHDELILEVAEADVERAKVLLKEEMEHAAKLQVELTVDVSTGTTWYDAKE